MKYKALCALLCITLLVGLSPFGSFALTANDIMHYYNHEIHKVSERPLFSADGGINADVLQALMEILNAPELYPSQDNSAWPSGNGYFPFRAVTASDFSDFVLPEPQNRSHTAAIVIRLFETIENSEGAENGHLTEFTDQWWQLVFRSTDDGQDVLTLWMVNPYRHTNFAGSGSGYNSGRSDERFSSWRHEGGEFRNRWLRTTVEENTNQTDAEILDEQPASPDFFFEGNYGASIARANLLRDLSFLLEAFDVEDYLVAPRDLPGNWQSSRFQTGTNNFGRFYVSGDFAPNSENLAQHGSLNFRTGLGASGRWGTIDSFNVNNGLDGLGIGPVSGRFGHTAPVSSYDDLLWIPSEFEIRIMGHEKDTPWLQTYINNFARPDTDLVFNTRGDHAVPRGGRTGLWRLNGFDRGFNPYVLGDSTEFSNYVSWTRSAVTNGLGNSNVVSAHGNRYGLGVRYQAGLRPAVHLCLNSLNAE